MTTYNDFLAKKGEKKWQEKWEDNKIYEVTEDKDKEKFLGLIEFPYPSGAGLHVGHPRPFTAMDVICRKKRMEGKNVLYPIGFDAFGLPTENFAIKTGRQPAEGTKENIENFTRQLKMLGYSFDWSRAVDTTDPKYFKWTQWIFLQFVKHGLAYKKNVPINWCLSCKIGLANEEIVNGACERCGGEVEKRNKAQWMLSITKYADKLLKGLDDVDFVERAKTQQRNWIGKSEGAELDFSIEGHEEKISVYTTRIDTVFSGTFIILAPEHPLVKKITLSEQKNEIDLYIKKASTKSDLERTELQKEKTAAFTGSYAINPATGDRMPIWIADFVLAHYGTGAVFADAHDERDFELAKIYNIPLKLSVRPKDDVLWGQVKNFEVCYPEKGILINSLQFDGLSSDEAMPKIIDWLAEKGVAKKQVNFRLRDWVFSRQRYWGEPIPLVWCDACNEWVAVPDEELPLELPKVEKYEPTDTGESPLAAMTDWVNTTCPKCGGAGKRETDTMPNWAGSSWYWLRYMDPHNDEAFASKEALNYWGQVDWYNGGMEHTVLHLLYSRFWNQFLHKIGEVPHSEPYKKRTSHGMILAEGGEKMSKSKGNVVNPDDMVAEFGADALRTYIMFMGPFDQDAEWNTKGLVGVKRFLDRIWNLKTVVCSEQACLFNEKVESELHKTIKKVTEDIEDLGFNTAIARMMEFVNFVQKNGITKDQYEILLKLLSPFAPHMTEDIWASLGYDTSITLESWPKYDEKFLVEDTITLAVQVNGKLRATIEVAADISEDDVKELALGHENVLKWVEGKDVKKVIYVKGRLVSVVV
ncbi:MAG: leucine--tRNA ligase [Candidatus Magasanikbacteria bacterium]|nr:leucine--tRNA ligase [Candidatus Magasanikbacteria bacterium]